MGNKPRIGKYTRTQIKQIALKLVLNNLDKYISETFDNEGVLLLLYYDFDVCDQIEKEIKLIRSNIFRQLFRATMRADLLRKIATILKFDYRYSRRKIDIESFPEATKILQRIVRNKKPGGLRAIQ